MEKVLMDEVVYTDYGQFDLIWHPEGGFDGDYDRFFDGQVNGLVGAADPHGVYINLSRRYGGSRVRIIVHDDLPPPPADMFQDVVEISCTIPECATPQWMSWAGETVEDIDGLEPGSYRLRVSGQDRDAARDGAGSDKVVDQYVLEFWRASFADDTVIRVGSDDARYWHSEIGSRR